MIIANVSKPVLGSGLLMLMAVGAAAPNPAGAESPSPLATATPFAGAPPIHPFTREASGAFSRTLFSAPGPKDVTVTVRDVVIGPERTQEISALPGPAVIEWFEGHGTFSVAGGLSQAIGNELQVIPTGQAITVKNPNRLPVGFRLYIFSGQ